MSEPAPAVTMRDDDPAVVELHAAVHGGDVAAMWRRSGGS